METRKGNKSSLDTLKCFEMTLGCITTLYHRSSILLVVANTITVYVLVVCCILIGCIVSLARHYNSFVGLAVAIVIYYN